MGPFVVIVLFPVCFLLLLAVMAHAKHGIAIACFVSAILLIPSLVVAFQCLFTIVVGIFCGLFEAKPRTFVIAAVGVTLVGYAATISLTLPSIQERAALRNDFPFVSVAERLSYETKRQETFEQSEAVQLPALNPEVETRLAEFEQRSGSGFGFRHYRLQDLHNHSSALFEMAQGFGITRMPRARRENITLPKPPPLPLPAPPKFESPYDNLQTIDERLAEQNGSRLQPVRKELQSMHTAGLERFFDLDETGYVRERQMVSGFGSHRFRDDQWLDPEEKEEEEWQVTRLELVSLLKHDVPLVYASKELPTIEKLDEFPTRPLNAFEKKSLEKLRAEEDLVIENELNQIRMLGSLRAGKDCMECHSVNRGDLLGAFSYELHRKKPLKPPAKKPPTEPQASWFPRDVGWGDSPTVSLAEDLKVGLSPQPTF